MSANRAASLEAHFSSPGQQLKPILTSLNGDNSWLISIPRPVSEREKLGKAYFHAVHDPWLTGPTSLLSTYVISITLFKPASVADGSGVEAVVREIETAAATTTGITPSPPTEGTSPIDAIFINLQEIDHLHEPTLRTFNPQIPVFAATEAANKIRNFSYFTTVVTNKDFQPDQPSWTTLHPGAPLPSWLTIFRMTGHHTLNLATAIIYSPTPSTHEAFLYSPHGISITQPSLQTLLHSATPKFSTRAILHGLKESRSLGWQNTFGVEYGLKMYRESGAKYWVVSHNSPLQYQGLIAKVISDVERTLEWVLAREKQGDVEGKLEKEGVELVSVENGECFVLS